MIRVILERRIREGKYSEFAERLKELRMAAVRQPGYVSGEVLSSVDDTSRVLVISSWRNLNDWRKWAASEERARLAGRIDEVLTEKTEIKVYQIMTTE